MKKIIAVTAATLAIAGCSNMSNTEQRTLSGAGIGAAAGAVGTAIFHGNPIWGAVGGAAVGAASGYVYDAYKKNEASIITMQAITLVKAISQLKRLTKFHS
ncbi:glycine zipper domain-containing protein [Polynucleobacter necessarius]|uniref:glycine zipper domain-containing protein n=1 Tax=Polynucleobacter necessarius TaxID=576610 RepID=UPI001E546EE2|nr:glycine zipper domain-containing protein [Polynucleobacter necessarius]